MAGIYIHIPFCKQACYYCNFHFSTSLKYKQQMLDAILLEIELQKDYLQGAEIQSIYFGGGTPSLLSQKELLIIFEQVYRFHNVSKNAEITLEANPDDLNVQKIQELRATPINRFSIGIQSFFEEDLKFMNRAHSVEEATQCIESVKAAGFSNITIDLIYGSPTTSKEHWEKNIEKALAYDIPHLSCYCLTVEEGTALNHFVKKGKVKPIDEEKAADQYEFLMDRLMAEGYLHYEISNFAKANHLAIHNTNYWKGVSYLGIGPSAHSFNGTTRQWNMAHNPKYIRALADNKVPFEKETLSLQDQYNEYILTSLRTMWGCEKEQIENFGKDITKHFQDKIYPFLNNNQLIQKNNNYILTKTGKLLADKIAMELFL